MLRIRMRKPGKSVKSKHHYKIVVTEMSKSRDGIFVEQIGFHDPEHDLLKLDTVAYDSWVKKGAQPSVTVVRLYKKVKKLNINYVKDTLISHLSILASIGVYRISTIRAMLKLLFKTMPNKEF